MGRQSGYTIIEVTLFLAITGLLILAVVVGFSGTINNNRRTDTTRSFEGAIEQIYSSVRSGEASRGVDTHGKVTCKAEQAYPGASNECVIVGKLLAILGDKKTINVYNVISNVQPDSGCSGTGLDNIKCYHPLVLDMTQPVTIISPEWQATIPRVTFQNRGTGTYQTGVNVIVFLRQPTSELVYIAPFVEGTLSTLVSTSTPYEITSKLDNLYANTKGYICLNHNAGLQPKSYVRFNGGEGVGSIDTSDSILAGAPAC